MMTKESEMGVLYVLALAIGVAGAQLTLDTGYVLDAETGEPLAGVHVVARWRGYRFVGIESKSDCFAVDAAQTDWTGRYTLLSLSLNTNPLLLDRMQTVFYYKPGYQIAVGGSNVLRWVTELKRDESVALNRLKQIVTRTDSFNCGSESDQRDHLLPYVKEVYEEARRIAHSSEELGWVEAALWVVEDVQLGREKAIAHRDVRLGRKGMSN